MCAAQRASAASAALACGAGHRVSSIQSSPGHANSAYPLGAKPGQQPPGFAYNYRFAGNTGAAGGRGYGSAMILDVTEFQNILPHRYPFLFVAAITEIGRLNPVAASTTAP